MKKLFVVLFSLICLAAFESPAQDANGPLRLAVVGLVHDHAYGFFPLLRKHSDVQLVGIVETNQELIDRYSRRFDLNPALFYPSLDALFAATNVQAVATFTSVYDHCGVIQTCAAHHVDVMVEKPMAANMKQAREIAAAVRKSGIKLVVNYETSWYPGNLEAYKMVHDEHMIGKIRRIIAHDGHNGPKEIGCSTNFLAWLTDPVLNGGGALNDFGCYGADLATWLLDGQKPKSVFAVIRHFKPKIYPRVEDDATVVLTYPTATVILEPSWDWPFNVKDLDIYGQKGYVFVPEPDVMRVRIQDRNNGDEQDVTPPPLQGYNTDQLSYLAAVVHGEIEPAGLASLDVNMTVMEILDAARRSAETGKAVKL